MRLIKTAVCVALLLGASHCGGQPGLSAGQSAPLAKHVDVGLLCKSSDLPFLTNYFMAINENGARLVPLPYQGSTNPSPLLLTISALLIPGGDDVDPDLYHEKTNANVKLDNPDRRFDDYECASIKQAEARKIPMLGICRGLQILNVSFKGTLFQDLPSQLGTNVPHRLRPNGKTQPCFHEITIQKGSLLFLSLQTERLEVNSYHHQGIKALGEGLVPTAWADDRLVEGFENMNGSILAVQFHPEKMRATNLLFNAIFRDFINRAAASQP